MSAAAVLLAVALLVTPDSTRSRLGLIGRRPVRIRSAWIGVPAALVGLVLLPPATVIAAAIISGTLVLRRRCARHRSARSAEATGMRDGLEILVGELRVGAHQVAALAAAAGEVGGDVGARLQTVSARGRMGGDIAAGLHAVASCSPIAPSWRRLAVCWGLAQQHGLAVATLMRAAQHDIIERDRFRQRLDAGLAGARTTAAVLAGMPVLGLAMGQLIGADPVAFLLSGGVGGAVLVVGVALSCLGLWWSERIIARVAA